jgi:hypothetical protein
MQAQHRRHANGQMNVGAALGKPELQKCINARHGGILQGCEFALQRGTE